MNKELQEELESEVRFHLADVIDKYEGIDFADVGYYLLTQEDFSTHPITYKEWLDYYGFDVIGDDPEQTVKVIVEVVGRKILKKLLREEDSYDGLTYEVIEDIRRQLLDFNY